MEEVSNKTEAPRAELETEFKKPVLIGRIGKLPKKANAEVVKASQVEQKAEGGPVAPESSSKSDLPPAVLLKELSTPIPYKEPKWSGLCPDGSEYALEVLKSGMIVEKVELINKPYYVFGRLANCDVMMAHPTVSRHHAVIQYKAFAEPDEPPCGWYLYDLASTHGTHLNRERLKANHYTRVRVGHQIKFGNSTRTYILLFFDDSTLKPECNGFRVGGSHAKIAGWFRLRPGLAPLTFSEFYLTFTTSISVKENLKKSRSHLRSNSTICVKYPIRTGSAWAVAIYLA